MIKLYIIGKVPWEDVNSRGKEGIFRTLDNEHTINLYDVEFERWYLPVICEKCKTPNILIAEDIQPVESNEREMGMEIAYLSRAYGNCINCKRKMEAEITIYEYPVSFFQFFEIGEKDGCKTVEIGNLNSLIEDVIWAQKIREEYQE